ncbi:hypothetical protein LG52_3571 [Geobacillus kaustophilus]|uniref:Uncharacterized protein n=1 Tax=Geobacillus kaustophilus TaxID=1462 RepID=A0A0D8BXQ5_GEOKU|nr:hypothetical protein LG52_3571 [Geobacillus kaustophilus]
MKIQSRLWAAECWKKGANSCLFRSGRERKHSPPAERLSFSVPAHIMREDVNGKEEWNEWD